MTMTSAQSATQRLLALGQSVWLDYLSRDLVQSGKLKQMVADGKVTGMTSNPTIFEKSLAGSDAYDADLAELAKQPGLAPYDAFVSLATTDIRACCDVLRPVYDATEGRDGFVSLELPPGIEHDTDASVAEAKRLWRLVDRPNLMIKVPGTAEGVPAVTALICEGVNVNLTLMFSVTVYEKVAEAYLRGLEQRIALGRPLDRISSVASFFVSRVDTVVDKQLPADSPLRGRVAVANARHAYGRFLAIFAGPRWQRLADAGARLQRPLWASTGTKDPKYSDILYVEDLIAPDTINTMPEKTLDAVLDHLTVQPSIVDHLDDAKQTLNAARAAGIDLAAVTEGLLTAGLASFEKDFHTLLNGVAASMALARVGKPPAADTLGSLAAPVRETLEGLDHDDVVKRAWQRDHTVWKDDPTEVADRLGWLDIADRMADQARDLGAFARGVAADGYRDAVLLGMGGSSLAPEVLQETLGTAEGMLRLHVLDTTDPVQIAALESGLDLAHTFFVVSSKSGGTVETMSQFDYFWTKAPNGQQYAVITDPGSHLEQLGQQRAVRRIFAGDPEIGGRYSALSAFGLVPAALIGADIPRLLARATDMERACGASVPAVENPGAWLGAVLGAAAKEGCDKLTLVLPSALHALGYWIEQLIAESTGKEGRGILPVEGEDLGAPEVYGGDRIFVAIGDHPRLAALEAAGHPVVRLPYTDPYQLGTEFFRWEFATAIAGHVLGINAFDQPNVQEAKDATNRFLAGGQPQVQTDSLESVLGEVKPGDYIAITAYLPRNAGTIARLQAVRMALRDRFHTATTVGFGPRFLHSTGQLHKGGANTGVFLQVVPGARPDISIPGKEYSFGTLQAAQADGDVASLQAHGRRVTRVTLDALEQEAQR